jgi:hypothetical protein
VSALCRELTCSRMDLLYCLEPKLEVGNCLSTVRSLLPPLKGPCASSSTQILLGLWSILLALGERRGEALLGLYGSGGTVVYLVTSLFWQLNNPHWHVARRTTKATTMFVLSEYGRTTFVDMSTTSCLLHCIPLCLLKLNFSVDLLQHGGYGLLLVRSILALLSIFPITIDGETRL